MWPVRARFPHPRRVTGPRTKVTPPGGWPREPISEMGPKMWVCPRGSGRSLLGGLRERGRALLDLGGYCVRRGLTQPRIKGILNPSLEIPSPDQPTPTATPIHPLPIPPEISLF